MSLGKVLLLGVMAGVTAGAVLGALYNPEKKSETENESTGKKVNSFDSKGDDFTDFLYTLPDNSIHPNKKTSYLNAHRQFISAVSSFI